MHTVGLSILPPGPPWPYLKVPQEAAATSPGSLYASPWASLGSLPDMCAVVRMSTPGEALLTAHSH